jgi:Ca2+-binding EF-hand superfamily protein
MMNGISSSSAYFGQMQGMGQKQGSGDRFAKLDADGNGGIDTSELQTLTDQMAAKTGMDISVEEVSATYDADNDGLLNQEETKSMMMEIRQKMGPQQQNGMHSTQSLSAYQADEDMTQTLLDMLTEQDQDQNQNRERTTYTPFSTEV